MHSNNECKINMKYPPITSYLTIASLLSMLWAHKEVALPWMADRFIQIYAKTVNNKEELTFYLKKKWIGFHDFISLDSNIITYECPFVNVCKMDRTTLNISSFSSLVESHIDKGYYIETLLDNYFISTSSRFHREHFWHQTLIYGYNRKEKQMLIADFYSKGKFIFVTIPYEELDQAYKSCKINEDSPCWQKSIFITQYVNHFYHFDLELVKRSYDDYLNSRNSFQRNHEEDIQSNKQTYYGLECYERLIDHCQMANSMKGLFDRSAFHVLCDHKKMLEIRLEYLIHHKFIRQGAINELIAGCNELVENTMLLRNLVLKYNITLDERLSDKVKYKIEQLKQIDKQYVEKLVSDL